MFNYSRECLLKLSALIALIICLVLGNVYNQEVQLNNMLNYVENCVKWNGIDIQRSKGLKKHASAELANTLNIEEINSLYQKIGIFGCEV